MLTDNRVYLRNEAKLLQVEAFKVGETGLRPKNTSKREIVTFSDSIVASAADGIPSADM